MINSYDVEIILEDFHNEIFMYDRFLSKFINFDSMNKIIEEI